MSSKHTHLRRNLKRSRVIDAAKRALVQSHSLLRRALFLPVSISRISYSARSKLIGR